MDEYEVTLGNRGTFRMKLTAADAKKYGDKAKKAGKLTAKKSSGGSAAAGAGDGK